MLVYISGIVKACLSLARVFSRKSAWASSHRYTMLWLGMSSREQIDRKLWSVVAISSQIASAISGCSWLVVPFWPFHSGWPPIRRSSRKASALLGRKTVDLSSEIA
jgi:hypothetical protein